MVPARARTGVGSLVPLRDFPQGPDENPALDADPFPWRGRRADLGGLFGTTRLARCLPAMLNASLGRDADAMVPPLAAGASLQPPPAWPAVKAVLVERPELAAGRADIARANADVLVVRDMYKPMATIRTGPSYTMTDGRGLMLMVGVSLPIWRGRLRAGSAEAEAMRDMARADLDAMARMVEGQAAVTLNQVQAAREH